jgi:hypothetical protein
MDRLLRLRSKSADAYMSIPSTVVSWTSVNICLGPQIIVEDQTSRYLIGWLAVLLGLTVPCVYVLFRRLFLAILPATWATPSTDESKTLFGYLEAPGDEDNPLKATRAVWQHAGEGQIALPTNSGMLPAFVDFLSRTRRAFETMFYDVYNFLSLSFLVLFFLGLFIGGVFVQVFDSDMADGYVVSSVSGSQQAGNWKPELTSASYLHGESFAVNEDRQRRIWEYKDACYTGSRSDSRCEVFYNQIIPSTGEPNASCPFGAGACLYGKTGAYKRTTELIDSNILGINAASSKRVYFRKTMVCSPITTEGFVTTEGPPTYPNNYLYDYGPWRGDNITFTNPREWWLDSTIDDRYKLE